MPSGTWVLGEYARGFDGSLNGSIADVQIYNTTLDSTQLSLLYREGIGSAPIAPQSE